MGQITGTCGHELDPEWFESGRGDIRVRDSLKDGSPAVAYITVCPKCRDWYRLAGLILKNRRAEQRYLRRKKGRNP